MVLDIFCHQLGGICQLEGVYDITTADLTVVTLAIEETDKEDANEYEDDVLNMLC